MEEKRKLPRFNLQFPTRIEVLDGDRSSETRTINLITRNICSDGAFLKTGDPLPEGTRVKIQVFFSFAESKLSAGASSLIKAEGVVERSDPEGMAVRFRKNYRIVPLAKV
jgi:hypothetical protein